MYPDMDLETLYPKDKISKNGGKLIFKNEGEFKIYLRNLKIEKKLKQKQQQNTLSEVSGYTEYKSFTTFKTTKKGSTKTSHKKEFKSSKKGGRQFRRFEEPIEQRSEAGSRGG